MIKDKLNLEGRVAVVTGASRGIGEEIARQLASCGAKLVISSRSLESCESVAAALRESGADAIAIAAHAAKSDDLKALMDKAAAHYGRINILVNNAGTNPHFGPTIHCEEEAWDKIFDVNVKGYYLAIKHALPHMKNSEGAVVLNNASIAGISPMPMLGAYSISKAAVIGLTKTFARELGPYKVRVNAIAPGLVHTKFADMLVSNDAMLEVAMQRSIIGRVGTTEEIADVAAFLCSDAASYVTGAIWLIDGGDCV